MISNDIFCYVCNQVIKNREEASYIGKDDITGKDKFRHRRNCSPHGLKSRPREQWYINPKTKIKKSDKIYDRNKDKANFRKELERD